MDNIDVRKYIINNFKDDSLEDIRMSIDSSIESGEEDILIGLGVLFEVMWNKCDDGERKKILSNIRKGLNE